MIYLATPYTAGTSHMSKEGKIETINERYQQTKEYLVKHMDECIFSPIVHSHEIANEFDLPLTFEYWSEVNHKFLDACSELWVLQLDGWSVSEGIADEIKYAIENDMIIKYKEFI